mgnify:CR=1 FL=1
MPCYRPRPPLTPSEVDRLWERTALLPAAAPTGLDPALATLPLPERLPRLLEWLTQRPHKRPEDMYCFILYDIENNKVRRVVAKYLERKGCTRIQKSVFFVMLHRNLHKEICATLRKIQSAYDNHDSIVVLPVGEDMLNGLLCIGKNLDFELLTTHRSTLFF